MQATRFILLKFALAAIFSVPAASAGTCEGERCDMPCCTQASATALRSGPHLLPLRRCGYRCSQRISRPRQPGHPS